MKQLSYLSGTTTIPLLGETIGANLKRTAERFPNTEALICCAQNYRATYAEFFEQTTEMALGLLAIGVQKGDRVGVWSPNRYEWVVLQYASARVGAIMVNISPAYKSAELEYALNQSGTSVLFLAKGFRKTSYPELLETVRSRCPKLRLAMVIDNDWEVVRAAGHRVSMQLLEECEASLQFDDPINIQYTSGTTGFPKGATLSHHNVLNNGFFIGETLKFSEKDKLCVPVPFYHCFGMVLSNLACTTHGATIVTPGEEFDPLATLKAVENEKCTSLNGVPTMFIAELQHPEFEKFDLSSLRTGIMAGSPCPIEVMKEVQSKMNMREITICYGMTETSPVSTQSHVDDPLEKRVSTVGRIHPHVEIKLVDPGTGNIVPQGTPGELCTRGYGVMLGYWNNPEATAEAIDKARWMHSGDLATIDADGFVNIVGRLKDMIIRGGENVYPREIEEFLHTHPDVAEAQVIGIPSKKYGEEVMAWVKLKRDTSLSGEELKAYCQGKIATFKIPHHWKFVDAFPMTVTGKIQKYRMRELSINELGLSIASATRTA
ncbi:MAG: AMP-binding protein [Cystobacterineae bacterium]|nr:AMP-binding protein [Cystobacterineae bacterium]